MEKNVKYITAKNIKEKYNVTAAALRKWAIAGKIEVVRTPGGKRMYKADQVGALFGEVGTIERDKIAYARVSSEHQRGDLDRQIEDLKKACPDHKIISDIGSGLNWKRKGLKAILDACCDGTVEEVTVARKDRLCRFGFELIEYFLCKLNVKLVVLHQSPEDTDNDSRELSDDLLSIVTVFVARNNGQRAAENRRLRRIGHIKDELPTEAREEENMFQLD